MGKELSRHTPTFLVFIPYCIREKGRSCPIAGLMAARRVQLFYDVLSPYSWVAFEILCRYQKKWNITLDLCPFFLSGIMKGSDNRPPGVVPAKANYMGKDLRRLATYYQIPLQTPSNVPEALFVKGSLSAMRLLTATKIGSQDHVEVLSRQLWNRIWGTDKDITTEESLREACATAGLELELADNLIGQIGESSVKEELKRSTQEALDLGAFGAPFIVIHDDDGNKERFFGSDRFELIAFTLGERWEGPLLEHAAKI